MVKFRKSAFVVDDDPVFADSISLHLQKSGFDVTCFSSGPGALRQLCATLDLIVLDYDLGERLTGLHYLRTIRHAMPNVPVLFLSKQNDTKAASQALGMGASFYIEKNSSFLEKLPDAINYMDNEKKSGFEKRLKAFRRTIFSFYNF
jgi:two-component system OmpR family response regulator